MGGWRILGNERKIQEMKEVLKKYGKTYLLYAFAVLFSICSVLGYTVDKDMSWLSIFSKDYCFKMLVIAVIAFLSFLFVVRVIIKCMMLPPPKKKCSKESLYIQWFKENTFLCSFLVISIAWIPIIFIFLPGSLINDAATQIKQFMGILELTSHHPPFSTLILGSCFYVGHMMGNDNFGFFLYTLLQYFCIITVFSKGVKSCTKNWNSFWGILTLLFFAFFPVWISYTQAILKDGLYMASVVWFILVLIDVVESKEKNWKLFAKLTISGILVSFLRNNGIYIIWGVLIVGLFCLKEKRKIYSYSLGSIIIVFYIYSHVLLPSIGVKPGSKAEMLSIPFQQTALYVKEHESEVTEDEKK